MSKTQDLVFRCKAYQEKDGSYTGVCLDLDIIEEGHHSLSEAVSNISEAVDCHLMSIKDLGYPKELLNRPAPNDYWQKLSQITTPKKPDHLSVENFQFFDFHPQYARSRSAI